MHGFDIYFAGEIVAGQDPAKVRTNIGKIFKLSGGKLEALFSGSQVRIKANVKAKEAGKYRQLFLRVGGLITVLPAGSKPPSAEHDPVFKPQSEPAQEKADGMQLLPAHTGSLIDTSKPSAHFDLSRADQFSLSPAGALLPESPPKPAYKSDDISHMEILPANTGSLEEFVVSRTPVTPPDIDHLKMLQDGNLSDEAEQPVPADLPSTDHLQADPANSGSLEDCVQTKPSVQIPDISSVKLAD